MTSGKFRINRQIYIVFFCSFGYWQSMRQKEPVNVYKHKNFFHGLLIIPSPQNAKAHQQLGYKPFQS